MRNFCFRRLKWVAGAGPPILVYLREGRLLDENLQRIWTGIVSPELCGEEVVAGRGKCFTMPSNKLSAVGEITDKLGLDGLCKWERETWPKFLNE